MSAPAPTKNSPAFALQAGIAFAVSLLGLVWAILYVPVDPWVRAFFAMTTLFLVSSAFTLAKVIRDAQDEKYIASRLDQARVDKLLSEHDLLGSI